MVSKKEFTEMLMSFKDSIIKEIKEVSDDLRNFGSSEIQPLKEEVSKLKSGIRKVRLKV